LTLTRPGPGKSGNIYKSRNLWIVAGFGNHNSAIGVSDENHGAILRINNELRRGDIVG